MRLVAPPVGLSAFDEMVMRRYGLEFVAGCDEVGRGAHAGDLMAACVVFPSGIVIPGLNDSKKLTSDKRESLLPRILESALFCEVCRVSSAEIDEKGVDAANIKAMFECSRLPDRFDQRVVHVVDQAPSFPRRPHVMLSKADAKSQAVAAASIVAKVTRDRELVRLSEEFPEYGWASNKGYMDAVHRRAVKEHGLTPHHRRTYKIS